MPHPFCAVPESVLVVVNDFWLFHNVRPKRQVKFLPRCWAHVKPQSLACGSLTTVLKEGWLWSFWFVFWQVVSYGKRLFCARCFTINRISRELYFIFFLVMFFDCLRFITQVVFTRSYWVYFVLHFHKVLVSPRHGSVRATAPRFATDLTSLSCYVLPLGFPWVAAFSLGTRKYKKRVLGWGGAGLLRNFTLFVVRNHLFHYIRGTVRFFGK